MTTFAAQHPYLFAALVVVGIFVMGAWVNWATYKRSHADWVAYQTAHPILANLIRASRAVFPHLRKLAPLLFAASAPVDEDRPDYVPPKDPQ